MKRIAQVLASAALVACGMIILAPTAKADTYQDYNLAWSGQAPLFTNPSSPLYCPDCTLNNNATATGTMTLDLSTITNPNNYEDITGSITAISVTVSGSADPTANGTFGLADLNNAFWNTNNATFDMQGNVMQQLLDQEIANPQNADFNLDFSSNTLDPPSGCFYLTLCAGEYSPDSGQTYIGGEPMGLTEFCPVGSACTTVYPSSVPEPGTSTLLLTGLVLLGLMAVAKKRAWLRPGHQEVV